ncbi:hypothetical protein BJX96DRAFT_140980 [Aspergillus floccosus]
MQETNQSKAGSSRWMPTWTRTRMYFQCTQVPSPPSHSPDFVAPIQARQPRSKPLAASNLGHPFASHVSW